MGKESKLKSATTSRYINGNGTRKLFELNSMPDGCDEDVWSLALYFCEQAESRGWSAQSPVVVYTVLFDRLSKDQSLKVILDKNPPRVVLSSIDGGGGVSPHTIVEYMIEAYYSSYSSNRLPSINDFCSIEAFNSYKQLIAIRLQLEYIKTNYTRESVALEPPSEARKLPLDNPPATWYPGSAGSEEASAKLATWRVNHNEPGK